ncbi:MAG: hypothetical protein H6721_23350 [Sandaracinus sp.]|nr:hypothetical protein [Myxococcales bacterium]MCB9603753.1 hypothetical protein [Sandaracinus sp.]MCB9635073.1 hypothetical protein [Sandaracinus sp.]
MRRLVFSLTSAPLAIPLLACLASPAPEGDLVGDFLVQGVLEANECGAAAVPANETIELRVQVRRDGNLASWRTPAGGVVRGVHGDGEFAFSVASTIPIYEADPALGTAGCSLDQLESITVVAEVEAQERDDDASVDSDASVDGDASVEDDAGRADAGVSASDAGTSVTATRLEGQSILRFRPSAGSACAPLLAIQGGPFDDLPCEVRYRLQGTPTDPLFE